MNVGADYAVVFDNGSAVDNAVFADYRASVEYDSGHYDGSSPYD